MEASPSCVDLSTTPHLFVKRGGAGNGNGQNWPLRCFSIATSSVTKIVVVNPPWEGLVGLFIGESFFDMISYSIPKDNDNC